MRLNVQDAVYILSKRKGMVVLFFLVVVVSTFFYTLSSPNIYKATTQILIEQGNKNIVGFQDVFPVDRAGIEYYRTQYTILKSRNVAKKLIKHLNLQEKYAGVKDPESLILSQVEVEPVKQSRLANVSGYSQDPQQAADVANGAVQMYIEQNFENKLGVTRQAAEWLEEKIGGVRAKLTGSEAELQRFKERHNHIDFGVIESSEQLISGMQMDLAKFKTELATLNQRYLPKHPKIITLKSQIEVLGKQLQEEMGKSLAIGNVVTEYINMKREVETNSKIYETMLSRMKETMATEGIEDTNVIVIDKAEVPTRPIAPRRAMNMLLGLLVGIFGGVGLAFLFEKLDNTIKSAEDLEKAGETSVLATISKWDVKENELIVHKDRFAAVSEIFRALRTALLFTSPDKPLKTMVISSANPQEGKTLVSSNLAVTIAQSGAKVLIVDADMRRPRLHKVFNHANSQGLSNVLTQSNDPLEFIYQSPIENLSVLFCGPIPPAPSELLGSRKMKELVEILRGHFDFVIFDTPPFLSITDSVVLTTHVDGVLVVARYNSTQKEVLNRALQSLRDVKANIVGTVLNDVNLERERYRYPYYSYYRSGYSDSRKPQTVSQSDNSPSPGKPKREAVSSTSTSSRALI